MKVDELNVLFNEWRKKGDFKPKGEKGQFVPDGIVDEEIYNRQKVKVLFLLKDPHDKDGNYSERGICDEVLTSMNSGKTWLPIAAWTRALLDDSADFADSKSIKAEEKGENDIDGARKYYRKIAVMNLKKASGNPTADIKKITTYVKDKENILDEIEIISPDIIIACGSEGVYDVFGKTCINNFYIRSKINKVDLNPKMNDYGHYLDIGEDINLNKKIILVEYCHPNNRGRGACTAREHYENMVLIRKKIIEGELAENLIR